MAHLVDRINRYLTVFGQILKTCLIRDLSFRFNVISRFITDIAWYLVNILFFKIIYMGSTQIYGWGKWEIMLFLGTAFVIDSLHMMFFYFNVFKIPEYVRNGELDSFLLKPINPKYLISIKNLNFSSVASLIFGIVIIITSFCNLHIHISLLQLFLYIGFILNGVIIMYFILFSCAILSVYFIKTEGLIETFFNIFQFGMKPDIIYNYALKLVITYVIPVIVIVNFPAKLIIEGFSLMNFVWGFVVTVLMSVISSVLWKCSLKKYTGASS